MDLVQKAYRLHRPFGEGLMPGLGLQFRREFDMGNSNFLFRTREWLRRHGCIQKPGEYWQAAVADWYRARGYVERPIVEWYVLFEGNRAVANKVPWRIKSSKHIKESDLDDFTIRIVLADGSRFFAKAPGDGGHTSVFVPPDEVRDTDLPAYLPATKKLKQFTVAPSIRPQDIFLPLMEGKWIHQFNFRAMSYVNGDGSWVVSRPTADDEDDCIPHYFMARLDSAVRTRDHAFKVGFRSTAKSADERSFISCVVPGLLPAGDSCPVLRPPKEDRRICCVPAILNSFVVDGLLCLLVSGKVGLHLIAQLPVPSEPLLDLSDLQSQVDAICSVRENEIPLCATVNIDTVRQLEPTGEVRCKVARLRAVVDSVVASLYELTPYEYARVLVGFPLLDRDQPPLPHDYRIRPTKKGIERRPISFITRDLALLTYFDYLAGRLEIKPDPKRVERICPDGVPEPPTEIVEFFAEAGVDIRGKTEYAVASTGPCRDLRERVARARELGAVAYVPTIDRRRATFVERAATTGGLSPEEGVLTPEMAQHVLQAKAERDAKGERARQLWEATPKDTTAEMAMKQKL